MTNVWTPKVGDKVKVSLVKAWGNDKGRLHCRYVTEVKQVTRAGFVRVAGRMGEKFAPAPTGRVYRQHVIKADLGVSSFHTSIEPANAEDIATLPTTAEDGRKYAKAQTQKETAAVG